MITVCQLCCEYAHIHRYLALADIPINRVVKHTFVYHTRLCCTSVEHTVWQAQYAAYFHQDDTVGNADSITKQYSANMLSVILLLVWQGEGQGSHLL